MSATEEGTYTISLQAKGEIKHIRVTNASGGGYSLGKSKNVFENIWDLIEAQLDQQLKSTKGDTEVQLIYPLEADEETIAPDLLANARSAGMDPAMFGADVNDLFSGKMSMAEVVAERKAKQAAAAAGN
jgi:hypothetical protein